MSPESSSESRSEPAPPGRGRAAPVYPAPVDRLLTLGEAPIRRWPWPDYVAELGLGAEHVPALVRMGTDDALLWADAGTPDVWAPVHAWRALGQLRAEEAVEPLLGLFDALPDDDAVKDELPRVFGLIGRAAIPPLARYLAEPAHDLWTRVAAARALAEIAGQDPSVRDRIVALLTERLEGFGENVPELNAFLISYLLDLHAAEAAPLMERVFAAGRAPVGVAGDWEDVQVALGLLAERRTPRPPLFPELDELMQRLSERGKARSVARAPTPPQDAGAKAGAKSRAKRKMARQSRKQARKRKRRKR